MSIKIDCYGESHIGQRRQDNEDQFVIADLNKSMRIQGTSLGLSDHSRLFGDSQGKLMLVADGLGGIEGGERASTLAVDAVSKYVLNTMDWCFKLSADDDSPFMDELKRSFIHSQNTIDAEAKAIPQRRGMATTLTMAYVHWPQLYVVHVGDTRCYLVRNETIKQLTTDHTVAELVRTAEAEMDIDDLPSNPAMNHALWNVVGGTDHDLHPQVSKLELKFDDTLLLCSDGLTGHVSDEELLDEILTEKSSTEICKSLINLANARGGKDNITVVLAKLCNAKTSGDAKQSCNSTIELSSDSTDPTSDTLKFENEI